mgnify:CR=1 FL=1
MQRDVDYLLRPEEAAQFLKISRATLYVLMERGQIPSVRIGRARRIPSEVLKKWLKERMETAPSPIPEELE